MPNITTPELEAITTDRDGCNFTSLEHLKGHESRPVGENGLPADQARHDRSEDIIRQEEVPSDEHLDDDEVPPVYQFPIVGTVQTRFIEIGRYQPLPFPESDD